MILRRLLPGSAVLLPVWLGLMAPGCTTEAYCFVCETTSNIDQGGAAGTGTGGTDINLAGTGGGGGSINIGGTGGSLPIGGAPTCMADTDNDPTNCGSCGTVCSLLGAFATCIGGECVIDECAESYRDLNMNDADGCEYVCPIFPIEEEVCDGEDNDCDGLKDEDFDLTTIDNCGSCGNACVLTSAEVACENQSQDPQAPNYQCVVTSCADGYANIDQVHSNGCEYECPVWPIERDPVTDEPIELCNAFDDDCDGVVNEGNPEGGQPCGAQCPNGNCQGLCTPGQTLCVGNGLVCVGGQGPEAEVCDGEDNDCNGVDDNGFNLNTDILNCGMCGRVCNVPNAIASCVGGQCVVGACVPGFADLNNNDNDGCEHTCAQYPTSTEVCDGIDNNCDGVVDRVSVTTPLTPPPGICPKNTGLCAGVTSSCTNGAWRCNYPNPNVETNAQGQILLEETKCDGLDGDCDGQTDESFTNKNQPCSSGQGICRRTGTFGCNAAGTGTQCNLTSPVVSAVSETCNGLDDDCDGQVDETAPQTGCTGVACSRATDAMVQVGSFWIYQYEASRPDAETTDVNTARACSKPGVLPWTSVNYTDAAAACAAVRNSANQPMRLCTGGDASATAAQREWQTACLSNSSGTGTTKWSYTTGELVYESGVCNDRSLYADPEDPADPAQAWLTDIFKDPAYMGSKECRTTATGIYNLSGNVAEWTSHQVDALGNTYYRVRGGSYLTYGPITGCDKTFVINLPTFQNHDLGFRCCSDAAP